MPRSIEVELRRDLVDACCAGDVVTVLGLVRVINTEGEAGKSKPLILLMHARCPYCR